MFTITTSIQIIRRALEAAEAKIGMVELARRLKAPESTVKAWRDGHGAPPQAKAVSLIHLMAQVLPDWTTES